MCAGNYSKALTCALLSVEFMLQVIRNDVEGYCGCSEWASDKFGIKLAEQVLPHLPDSMVINLAAMAPPRNRIPANSLTRELRKRRKVRNFCSSMSTPSMAYSSGCL